MGEKEGGRKTLVSSVSSPSVSQQCKMERGGVAKAEE